MKLTNKKAIKDIIHSRGKQISQDGLEAIDRKVEKFIEKICNTHNGSKKRIDSEVVYFCKV